MMENESFINEVALELLRNHSKYDDFKWRTSYKLETDADGIILIFEEEIKYLYRNTDVSFFENKLLLVRIAKAIVDLIDINWHFYVNPPFIYIYDRRLYHRGSDNKIERNK